MAKDQFDEKQIEEQETPPTDDSKNNESYVLTFDGSDQLTNIAMAIGGATYNRTITWTGSNPTAISSWVAA